MGNPIVRLGYAGFRGDTERWRAFACDLFGMQAVSGPAGELRLRTDERAWRIAVEDGEGSSCAYIGLELDTTQALAELEARLHARGLPAIRDPARAARRNVSEVVTTLSPDGTPLELFVGLRTVTAPFASPTGACFVTGDSGLGHVLLLVPDLFAALDFYENVIGLSRSDVIEMGPGVDAYFLNGGYRHHVVALASIPALGSGLDHIMLEVDSMRTVGQAWEKVEKGAAPIARSIGQHANDPALSFYVQTPSGCLFEYAYNCLVIPDLDRWVETRWESAYLWGGTFGSHAVR